jgi:hypothetical protein
MNSIKRYVYRQLDYLEYLKSKRTDIKKQSHKLALAIQTQKGDINQLDFALLSGGLINHLSRDSVIRLANIILSKHMITKDYRIKAVSNHLVLERI